MNIKPTYLIVAGALILIFGWLFMDVTVSTGYGSVINIHKLKNRENTMMVGGLIFLAGIILQASLGKQAKSIDEEESTARARVAAERTEKFKTNLEAIKKGLTSVLEKRDIDGIPIKERLLIGVFIGLSICLAASTSLLINDFPVSVFVISLALAGFGTSLRNSSIVHLYLGAFIAVGIIATFPVIATATFIFSEEYRVKLSNNDLDIFWIDLVFSIAAITVIGTTRVLLKRVKAIKSEYASRQP